jgi:DNA-binding transcriptional LysR family regulator
MTRSDLGNLTAFVAVADRRGFRAAAAQLGVTPSALSHSMRLLEERLGVRLLNRTTRSVSMTDAGHHLLDRLRPAMQQIDEALENLNKERERPLGRLRISARRVAAAAVIAPIWDRFVSTYPEIHLEVSLTEEPMDIVSKGFDAGIDIYMRVPADMIGVRLTGPMRVVVVGSPAYFAKRPRPRLPDDLTRHACVQFRRPDDHSVLVWSLARGGKTRRISVDGPVMVDDPDFGLRAAVDGLGLAYTAYTLEALAEPFLRSGQLIRVLEEWSPAIEGMMLYDPSRRHVPATLRALIDMLRSTSNAQSAKRSVRNPFIQK